MITTKSHNDYYKKYKCEYLDLKRNDPHNDNFYFVHNTTDINSIISMIKTGILFIGKYVEKSKRKHSGKEPRDYIYTNIYFEDLKNLSHFMDYSIILYPNIIHKYGAVFNQGWQVFPGKENSIHFFKNETPDEFNKKMDDVKSFLKNPNTLPGIIQGAPGLLHHEFLFNHNIKLKDSLIGIICNWCSSDEVDKLNKLLEKYSYCNVRISTTNLPFRLNESLNN